MSVKIRIPDASERDIDLLLLEEFVASTEFRDWFLSQIGVECAAALSDAARSVRTGNGETDVELTVQGHRGDIKVLIENKVDSAFRPFQPQRYATRAERYRADGQYQGVITVVMAPKVYFGDEAENYGFDAKVTYEDVLGWFSTPERADARMDYKRALLRRAIERGRTGWQLVPNPEVSRFWEMYWRLTNRIAPELSMPAPKKDIPAGSHFVVFAPAALPANIKLKHKVGYGNVDLEFRGKGSQLAEMDRRYQDALPPHTQIERAGKSAVIRARVDPVDMRQTDFASSEPAIRHAIETAIRLLRWYVNTSSPSTEPAEGARGTTEPQ